MIVRFACLGLLLLLPPLVNAGAPTPGAPLEVEIRASVDDLWQGARKKAPQPHGKRYYLISIGAAESEEPLVRPVDEPALVAQLKQALAAQGFSEITETEKPDVLLTVLYGRGYLKNPYLRQGVDEISPGLPTTSVTSSKQVFAQREAGYEARVQRAQREKLFITVRALKFPERAKDKPTRLWQTTMIVENPQLHDLNEVAGAMVRTGATYFDRNLPEEGVIVSSAEPGRPLLPR